MSRQEAYPEYYCSDPLAVVGRCVYSFFLMSNQGNCG